MNRFFVIGAFVAATFLAQLAAAQAEFFSLDGRFQCLESAAAVCGEPQSVMAPPPAPPPAPPAIAAVPPEPAAAAAPPPSSSPPAAAPAESSVSAAAAARPIDPLRVVAARIQTRRPTHNDVAWLAQAAHNGDARAVELLAWCKLNGIGMARDPVEAFLLYGAAGAAALPNARENQRLIYERDLDSDQRQQVLDLANEGVALAQLVASSH